MEERTALVSCTILQGDCREVLATMVPESIDAIVTDPPYGIGFMGREWDTFSPTTVSARKAKLTRKGTRRLPGAYPDKVNCDSQGAGVPINYDESRSGNQRFQAWVEEWARECLRVLKPGGHMLVCGGSRTFHRLAVGIEDAGFEIRDTLMFLHAQGFPKSLDVSKAIDKARRRDYVLAAIDLNLIVPGNNLHDWTKAEHSPGDAWWEKFKEHLPDDDWQRIERKVVDRKSGWFASQDGHNITAPATSEAEQWDGWGTALKPSYEPVLCARKPLNVVPLDSKLQTEITDLLGGLVCLSTSFASNAESSSASSPSASSEVSVSALLLAAVLHGELSADSSALMGTFRSPETASTCLSIAESWSSILDVAWNAPSTFTTATASSLTTTLTTLSCLLSATIPEHIIEVVFRPPGSLSNVTTADNRLSGDGSSSTLTLSAIAHALATWQHDNGSTDAPSVEPGSQAIIQSVDSVLKHALTELQVASAERLRPDVEPIIMARKPFPGNVAANVLKHGTGAINVDGCRVGSGNDRSSGGLRTGNERGTSYSLAVPQPARPVGGRWPPNVLMDPESAAILDEQSGASRYFPMLPIDDPETVRFRYQAKASRAERNAGLAGMPEKKRPGVFDDDSYEWKQPNGHVVAQPQQNHHPTVKPLSLMRWLVRLVTPPGGVVLDPFMGSGTTGIAAFMEGFDFIGIEQEAEYAAIAERRIRHAEQMGRQAALMTMNDPNPIGETT